METSNRNKKASSDVKAKVLELINDEGLIAPYLNSSLVNLFEPENTSQLKLIKDPNSIRMIDFLINRSIPVTLYSNVLTFTDSNKPFKLDGDLLKTITKLNFNVAHSNLEDQKLSYEFGKEMSFDYNRIGRKNNRHETLTNLFRSPAVIASGIPTKILSENPNELFGRLKLLLQEKQAGNNSDMINEEIVAMAQKLLEYKCIFAKQLKILLLKSFELIENFEVNRRILKCDYIRYAPAKCIHNKPT